jgi:hypothetical protein
MPARGHFHLARMRYPKTKNHPRHNRKRAVGRSADQEAERDV